MFLKDFFEKVKFEKKSADVNKSMSNYSACKWLKSSRVLVSLRLGTIRPDMTETLLTTTGKLFTLNKTRSLFVCALVSNHRFEQLCKNFERNIKFAFFSDPLDAPKNRLTVTKADLLSIHSISFGHVMTSIITLR